MMARKRKRLVPRRQPDGRPAQGGQSMMTAEPIWTVVGNTGFVTVREAERRIMRAMKTVRALPDREYRFQNRGNPVRCNLPILQDVMDAYGAEEARDPKFRPTPYDVGDMLTALAWVRGMDKSDVKILWWRSFDVSFSVIAARIGRSDETARQRYRQALLKVWHNAQEVAP